MSQEYHTGVHECVDPFLHDEGMEIEQAEIFAWLEQIEESARNTKMEIDSLDMNASEATSRFCILENRARVLISYIDGKRNANA